MTDKPKEPSAFRPTWPEGIEANKNYRMACDDKGRDGGSWMEVFIDDQGDAYLSAQDWEDILEPGSVPMPIPHIRIRTSVGGGRNRRTRQALLWLADAIRRDNEENGVTPE